jgi:voltage-gated potassium channel
VTQASRGSRTPWRLLAFASVPVVLIAAGTIGFHLIERWEWFDALYATVTTVTSIGYEGKYPLTSLGRIFTMALAIGGIFTIAAAAAELLGIIITGEFRDYREKRRMRRRIERLEHHIIVCGHGQVGQSVCRGLKDSGVPFVVVDRQVEAIAAARDRDALSVLGDATADATLADAGIGRARALIATAGADPENVLITMTARLLAPTLPIVARAKEETTVPKLLRAGATRTISPHAVVGGRLAQAVLRPAVLDLFQVATSERYPEIQVEEQLVDPGGPLDGKTVGTSGLRSQAQLVVAIKQRDGRVIFNPGTDMRVAGGDTLITLTIASRMLPRLGRRNGDGRASLARSGA